MELKRRFNWRRLVTVFYLMAVLTYLVLGLQPVEARHYEISGILNMPSIGLTSDVTTLELIDHRLDTPDTIVGSYNKYSSKTFLIGHSSTVFKNLNAVQVGEKFYYNDETYRIVAKDTFAKAEINMNSLLAPTKEQAIVIMTCAGEPMGEKDATHRLIVTAVKV